MEAADAVAELRLAAAYESAIALGAEDGSLPWLAVSTTPWHEGWSVLEAADAIAAVAMAAGHSPYHSETPAATGLTLGDQLRERDEALLLLIGGGHSQAPRQARVRRGRAAVAKTPARDLVSSAASHAD